MWALWLRTGGIIRIRVMLVRVGRLLRLSESYDLMIAINAQSGDFYFCRSCLSFIIHTTPRPHFPLFMAILIHLSCVMLACLADQAGLFTSVQMKWMEIPTSCYVGACVVAAGYVGMYIMMISDLVDKHATFVSSISYRLLKEPLS